jgi:high affinity Mn2+ porin
MRHFVLRCCECFIGALCLAYGVAALCAAPRALAGEDDKPAAATAAVQTPADAAWFGQSTNVTQWHPRFDAPYSGVNSLTPAPSSQETTDFTLFGGGRVWKGGEAWINLEVDQGFGLSNTVGVAGFPNGEAYKIGANAPYLRLPRAFFRQSFDFGGDAQAIELGPNQFDTVRTANNLVLTMGKFSVPDIFDTNAYAHDPRADFLNWAIIDAGAFDYAADSWAYTYGMAAEWCVSRWTLRGGVFDLSKVPNSKQQDPHFRQYEITGEIEQRHQWAGHDGKFKILAFLNRGRMADYEDAIRFAELNGGVPDVASARRYSSRPGGAMNFEQEVFSDLGVFARASLNDGRKETFEFTEINRSLSGGVSLHGDRWGRHDDVVGVAGVVNALSPQARDYFVAGGLGIVIGDGRLNYGMEKIAETYYAMKITKQITLSADYQYVTNPAYNRDRGPVSIFGARVHAEF